MKNFFIIPILSCCLLTSCFDDSLSKQHAHPVNQWDDFNDKAHNYCDLKMNVSTYFEDDYIVIGYIFGINTVETHLHQKIFQSNSSAKVDYSIVKFADSTGQQVVFDKNLDYVINSTRTIKISYKELDDSTKEIIEKDNETLYIKDELFYLSNYDCNSATSKKVQFGDNLLSLDV